MLADLQDKVGIKPYQIATEYDTPHLWGSIGEIINQVISFKEEQSLKNSTFKSEMVNIVDNERKQMEKVTVSTVEI